MPKPALEVVRELIQIHQDRVILYHEVLRALIHSKYQELRPMIGELIRESLDCQLELRSCLARQDRNGDGEEREYKGSIYRIWKIKKGSIRGDSVKAIMNSCEQESDAVRQAYEAALTTEDSMDNFLKRRLFMHLLKIRSVENRISEYPSGFPGVF